MNQTSIVYYSMTEMTVLELDLPSLFRITFSLIMLGYTSWIDVKTREIYDIVWIFFGALGLVIGVYEVVTGSLQIFDIVFPVVFTIALSLLLGRAGLFGFADVEAFIVLSILNPVPSSFIEPLFVVTSLIHPLTLFSNSALAGASFSIILLSINLSKMLSGVILFEGHEGDSALSKMVLMVTGMKMNISKIRGPPFQYPLETMDGEGRGIMMMPDIQDDDAANEIFKKLEKMNVDEVWVSYTLPFLVFILIGYVLTLVVGDLALFFLTRFLLRL